MATYFSTKLKITFDEATRRLRHNLHRQGFSAITTIDLKEALKRKLGMGFRRYRILGACNPENAYKLISLESHLGLMIPCKVVIQEHENGEVEVSAINPLVTIDKTESSPQISEIATEMSNRLRKAIDSLHAMDIESSSDAEAPRSFSLPDRVHGRTKIHTRWKNPMLG